MQVPRLSLADRLAQARGFALTELLVAMAIGLLVAAGGMTILQIAVRGQPKVSERAAQIQQGRAMMEIVSRELRQGESVESGASNEIEILTYVNSESCGGPPASTAILCRVTYSCEGAVCSRTEHDGAGGGSTRQVVEGLLGPGVFCYAPQRDESSCPAPIADDPSYVGITLAYPGADGDEAVTLRDGVALRNHSPPPETG